MAQPLPSSSIEALIEGGVSGQVAVGNHNVQIHADHGAVVFLTPPGTRPTPRLRPLPILQRPRPARGLVDRQADISSVLAAIRTALPVGIHGAPGIGKSTLLRHLAYAVDPGALPDGVVHLSARQQPAADVLQSLFEAFYESDAPCKPTAVQARQLLQGRRALVLLDDAELGREAAEELLDSAPNCAFVLATQERCLWGECQAIVLSGLPAEDARALFERELGRPLTAEEAPAFASLHARLGGSPLRVLQTAAQVREGAPLTAADILDEGSGQRALAALTEEQQRVLSALAAVGGGPVGAAHVPVLADVANSGPALDALREHKLVQSHSPRYSLTGNLPDVLPRAWDLTPWRERALGYFIPWAEARQNEPAALLEEAGVLRRLLDWAAETGRHAEARRLGRALDTALAVAGRWSAWEQTLERVRGAAEALGDRATEGWALHQLGTRCLCLDDKAEARRLLTQALAIREALGDRAGAAVTRHNLDLLGVPPSEPSGGKRSRPLLRLLPWLGIAVVVLIGIRLAWPLLPQLFREESSTEEEKETPTEPLDVTPEPNTDLTSEVIEATPPLDLTSEVDETPADTGTETGGGPLLKVRRRVTFPTLELGPSSSSQIEAVSVTNAGTVPLQVAGVSFTENPGQAFTLSSGCEHHAVSAGNSCLVSVLFHPPKAGKYRAVLAVNAEGLERRLVEVVGEAKETVRLGGCCIDGKVSSMSKDACEERRGKYFDDQKQAVIACQPPPVWCCADGNVSSMSKDACEGRRGKYFDDQKQAMIACQPPPGWCCFDGKVSEASESDCKGRGGTFFEDRATFICMPPHPGMELTPQRGLNFSEVEVGKSRSLSVTVRNTGNAPLKIDTVSLSERTREIEIDKRCSGEILPPKKTCSFFVTFMPATPGKRDLTLTVADRTAEIEQSLPLRATAFAAPVPVWCCADGRVSSMSKDACEERRGKYFDDQKQAVTACQPPPVWCCADGKVSSTSKDACERRGGKYFDDQRQAVTACQPPPVWCCADGKVSSMSKDACERRGGRYFDDQKEAMIACQPPPVWCCADGKVSLESKDDCTARRGRYFDNQREAMIACQPRGCCIQGEFIPGMSEDRCAAAKGTYMTEKEASSRCKKEEVKEVVVWCCLRGSRPFRTTLERCKSQRGSLYFETEKEALRNCRSVRPRRGT